MSQSTSRLPSFITYSRTNVRCGQSETLSPSLTCTHDGSELNFSATSLPTGLSIDQATGEITGTIDAAAVTGSVSVTITATCKYEPLTSTTTSVTINVLPAGAVSYIESNLAALILNMNAVSTGSVSFAINPLCIPASATNTNITWDIEGDKQAQASLAIVNGYISISFGVRPQNAVVLVGTAADGNGATITIPIYPEKPMVTIEPVYSARVEAIGGTDDMVYKNAPCYCILKNGDNVPVIKKVTTITETIFHGVSPSYYSYDGFTAYDFKHKVTFSDGTTAVVLDKYMYATYEDARIAWITDFCPALTDPWA